MRTIRAYVQPGVPGSPLTESAEITASVQSEGAATKRVFISHKTGDYPAARAISGPLFDLGLAAYFVHDDPAVAPGDRDQLPDEVRQAMRQSAALLVFASDRLVDQDSSWVCFEVGLAEMRNIPTARYTVTSRSADLLSPIRGLERVEKKLKAWAIDVKHA